MHELCIGLMSGTSMDAVDAALCAFDGARFHSVLTTASVSYPQPLRSQLLDLQRNHRALTVAELCELDNAVAEHFAAAVGEIMVSARRDAADIRAIGSHGQTVFHDPEGVRSSVQLGNPALIAALTRITTVADFRRADIALGGHGAPLVPAFHHALFADALEPRSIVNIGGIANITILPGDDHSGVRGFDTGPGNGLMDEWAELHLGELYDGGGKLAAAGTLDRGLLDALLADPYFARPPPKSTGRHYFNLAWAQRCCPHIGLLRPADVQRTFCELTAVTIAQAVRTYAPATRRVLPCGGGALNTFLVGRLRDALDGIAIDDPAGYGINVSWVEAAAFAWLAMRTLAGLPGNLPGVTGARRPAVLGAIYRA